MRLSSSVRCSSGERIGSLLLAAFLATLIWSLHSSASRSDTIFNRPESSNYSGGLPTPIDSPTPCCNDKPHLLIGTYYDVKNGLTAKLLLNNKGPDPLTASPTLFSMSGQTLFSTTRPFVALSSQQGVGELMCGAINPNVTKASRFRRRLISRDPE